MYRLVLGLMLGLALVPPAGAGPAGAVGQAPGDSARGPAVASGGRAAASTPRTGRIAVGGPAADALAELASGWIEADHAAVAELVADEGVRIALSEPGRESLYTASQAFYFFKSLFRTARTVSFDFQRLQEGDGGGGVHAVAEWVHQRPGAEGTVRELLLFSLLPCDSRWGLSEIRIIR
jgi:hypothetical protein